jgi:flagellar L-ring protein precursor FlgH
VLFRSTSRDGSAALSVDSLLGIDTSILEANSKMGGAITLGGTTSTSTTGTGKTSRAGSLTATVTCEVVEVLSNGNLRIRGTKEVRVNRETQYLTLEGVVRPRDILIDNTVPSDVIAGVLVEFTGAGAIAAQQHRGIVTSALDAVAPF